jgi:hypothetical protein
MQCNILVISLKSFKATEVEKHEVDTFLKNVLILHCPEKKWSPSTKQMSLKGTDTALHYPT